jgi:hypothetical protein
VSSNQAQVGLKKIPLPFCGLHAHPRGGWIALWNLLTDIPSHCKDSTVSEMTFAKAGYFVPNPTGLKRGDVFGQ